MIFQYTDNFNILLWVPKEASYFNKNELEILPRLQIDSINKNKVRIKYYVK
jgi:hypothetical protein